MKQEINETMEWLGGLIKKYGFWVGLAVALYFGIKKVWFWFVMPSMCFVTLNMLGTVFGWKWVAHLDVKSVVISESCEEIWSVDCGRAGSYLLVEEI